MKEKILHLIYSKYFIILFGVLLSFLISLQLYLAPKKDFGTGNEIYTNYNNYNIFKASFKHLKEEDNLYAHYANEHWDLYKYTPSFSLFMGVFYYMPNFIGLFLWNLLNVMILIWALLKMPLKNQKMYLWIFGFTLLELITSTQNTQSNALIAGLMIAGYNLLESKKYNLSILLISIAVVIKPFAIFGFIPFLFYPSLIQNLGKSIIVMLTLLLLPLTIVSPDYLIEQYSNWLDLLSSDHGAKVGYSVMGWLQTWFGLEVNKMALVIIGLVTLCIPLLRPKYFQSKNFQINYLALILIWIVIFNHMAESPTFVIAVAGVGIWFFNSKQSVLDKVLFVLVAVFTVLIATDLFPKSIRESIMEPYAIKGVPCILVYCKVLYDMMMYESERKLKNIKI